MCGVSRVVRVPFGTWSLKWLVGRGLKRGKKFNRRAFAAKFEEGPGEGSTFGGVE